MHGQVATDSGTVSQFEEIIGCTPPMKAIFAILTQVAKTDATVLLQGDSGTGKELAARNLEISRPVIHDLLKKHEVTARTFR